LIDTRSIIDAFESPPSDLQITNQRISSRQFSSRT
jgi:hypothetical protein